MPNVPDPSTLTTDDLPTDLQTDAANWALLQELYHLLEQTPVEEQSAALDRATLDPVLRTRVLSLLASSAEPEEALPAPPARGAVAAGARIGPYVVLRSLGSGGIGSVYLIERIVGGAVQHCALKLLAVRTTDASFRARFEREEQILATLQHPNITHLLDAGISDLGQPYLVMEFVGGLDLTRYCDERRLPLRQRLQIFLSICDAVIYAHSQLVVHLDLKPSNVLVTLSGTVKLLDFGTSKLLDIDSLLTTTIMATPVYASPEQLRGDPVSTSCDLYSLGVMLYELLSGHRPFESASAATAFHRAATEAEPPRLDTTIHAEAAANRGVSVPRLRRLLEGDLASMAALCLRSRPRDRYSSVEALATDLRSFLAGRPVTARRQTTAYRVGKFIRRNRTLVTVSALAAMAVTATTTYAIVREHEAIRETQRAVQMQTFLYRLLYVANANYLGKPSFKVPDFLELGARLAPDYVTNPADLRSAQLGLAESMFENDDMDGAAKLFAEVIRGARLAGDFNSEAEASATGGYIAFEQGDIPRAEAMTAHALELSRRRQASAEVRVWSPIYYGLVRDESGSRTGANLNLLERAVDEAVSVPLPPREIADARYNLALAYQRRGRYTDSEASYRQALTTYANDPEAQCDRADVRRGLATDEDGLGHYAESLSQYQQAWAEARQCSGEEGQSALNGATSVAESLLRLSRSADALPILQQVLAVSKAHGIGGPRLQRPTWLMARAYIDQHNVAAAETLLRTYASHVQSGAEQGTGPESGLLELTWAQAALGLDERAEALRHAKQAQRLLAAGEQTPAQREGASQAAALVEMLTR